MLILDPTTNKLIELIKTKNHKAYIVGGAIRDSALGIKYSDIDITIDATLDEIKEMFKDYKIVEYKKGHTIGVVFLDKYVELSSLDKNDINADLKNRDFTINAIALMDDKIIDPYNGLGDIKNRILRTLKKPIETIKEDPLRILRAIRFDAKLHLIVDKELLDVINNNYELLDTVSGERIASELNKILTVRKPSVVIEKYFNVFSYLFPALKATYKFNQHNKYHHLDVFEHTMAVLDSTDPIIELRYMALFHDIEKPSCFSMSEDGVGHFYNHYIKSAETAKAYLEKYNYSNEFVKKVYNVVYYHDYPLKLKESSILKFLHKYGTYDLDLYFKLRKADIIGQNPMLKDRIDEMNRIEVMTNNLVDRGIYKISDLAINGKQIQNLGYSEAITSKLLEEVLEAVMAKKIPNKLDDIIDYLDNNHFGDDTLE